MQLRLVVRPIERSPQCNSEPGVMQHPGLQCISDAYLLHPDRLCVQIVSLVGCHADHERSAALDSAWRTTVRISLFLFQIQIRIDSPYCPR
jgi:hypothetical protein